VGGARERALRGMGAVSLPRRRKKLAPPSHPHLDRSVRRTTWRVPNLPANEARLALRVGNERKEREVAIREVSIVSGLPGAPEAIFPSFRTERPFAPVRKGLHVGRRRARRHGRRTGCSRRARTLSAGWRSPISMAPCRFRRPPRPHRLPSAPSRSLPGFRPISSPPPASSPSPSRAPDLDPPFQRIAVPRPDLSFSPERASPSRRKTCPRRNPSPERNSTPLTRARFLHGPILQPASSGGPRRLSAGFRALPSAAFEGQLVREDGRPPSGCQVSVVGRSGSVRADREGRFAIHPTPALPFVLVVTGERGEIFPPVTVEALRPLGASRSDSSRASESRSPSSRGSLPPRSLSGGGCERGWAGGYRGAGAAEAGRRRQRGRRRLAYRRRGERCAGRPGALARPNAGSSRRRASHRRATAGASATFLDPFSLGSIEIARGPGSVAYGSDASEESSTPGFASRFTASRGRVGHFRGRRSRRRARRRG